MAYLCLHGKATQHIPILDLPLPTPLPAGAEWIEAYRRWSENRVGLVDGQ